MNINKKANVNPDNIPKLLKSRPQWVCWRLEIRNGKPTKTPYNPLGTPAKVNAPQTWVDYETALNAYQKGGFAGIGIVLTRDDPIIGIDLDKCLDPETGELDPDADSIVKSLPTYSEVSPSGKGIRLFALGKLPQGGRRKGKVEMYDSGRYLTVTGHRFNSHADIAECTTELAALHTKIFGSAKTGLSKPVKLESPAELVSPVSFPQRLELALRNPINHALYRGDNGSYSSNSEADMALCLRLMTFADGDTATVETWVNQSGRNREKWQRADYRQATLQKALTKWDGVCFSSNCGNKPQLTDTGGEPAPDTELNPYRGTDTANAALFLYRHGQDVRYCPPWEKWLIWSDSHWRIDDDLKVSSLVADLPLRLYQKAGKTADSTQRRQIAGLAHKLEKRNVQNDALALARCRVVVRHTDLDQEHYLLNASNGTVDLHTGAIRRHERADLLTHDIEVPYTPTATAPTWRVFLQSTFAGDADLIQFVQRAVGYSLTGDVREQVLLICHGVGSNGKSVFLNIIHKLLGRLAIQAAPDLLMADKQRRHPTEQADLFSKRLVVCQETGEGRRFNETLVKQLTGGDSIRARRMHEDFWEFKPTHKLWLSTNHKPEIRGTDHAIWRRIRLIPFNVKFTDDGPARKDPQMEVKLTAELPGILTWAVQGCLDWQRVGLQPSTAVIDATAQYQVEMDVLAAWISDCCVVKKHCEAKAADLYASYTTWCEQSGEYSEKQRKFGMRLTERGFERYSGNHGYAYWRGIGIKSCVDDVDHVDEDWQFFEPFSTREKNCQSSSTSSTSSTPQESDALSSHHSLVSVQLLQQCILNLLTGSPGGFSQEEIVRLCGKGRTPDMIERALTHLAKEGTIGRINGKWVAQESAQS